jgi:hypothetical protein
MKRILTLIVSVIWCGAVQAAGQTAQPKAERYEKSAFPAVQKLGADLQKSLAPKYRQQIHAVPVFLEPGAQPLLRVVAHPASPQPQCGVAMSGGFVDLVNNVAHAKAIDALQRGFFENYVRALSNGDNSGKLAAMPRLDDPRFWSGDVMNEQLSSFNQVMGAALAIKLAHHYLGHYQKYAAQLSDAQGNAVSINRLLTSREWNAAVEAGVQNALNSGYGVQGILQFYDCFDKMKTRPEWAEFFLPEKVKIKSLRKDIEKIERKFFGG